MKTTEHVLCKGRVKNNYTDRSVELKCMGQESILQNRRWPPSVIFTSGMFLVILFLCFFYHCVSISICAM